MGGRASNLSLGFSLLKTKPRLPIFLALALASCATIDLNAAPSSRDWQFVQSVGGLAIGKPQRDYRGHVLLPVRCDVSGTRTTTVRPTAINSALVCAPPSSRIRSRTLFLPIRTPTASIREADARCPAADLGTPPAGLYSVAYLSPDGSQHALGTIQVPQ